MRQIERTEYKILMVGEDSECNQRVKDILQKESIYEVIMQNTVNVEGVLERFEENSFLSWQQLQCCLLPLALKTQ